MFKKRCVCGWGDRTPLSRCGICNRRQWFRKLDTIRLYYPNKVGGIISCGHKRCIDSVRSNITAVVNGARERAR